jgi:hypothetical protein
MPLDDLNDEAIEVLLRLLRGAIDADRYPLSPRHDAEGDPCEAATRASAAGGFAGAEGL